MRGPSRFAIPFSRGTVSQGPERRLHRISLLFHLGAQLKNLLVPILVAVFATRSDTLQIVIGVAVALIATLSTVWNYLSYSYRYDEDDLVVRTGLFFRNERHIPYDRIQNIDAVQNVAHRFFKVAVVQVQTGSGAEPEATLSVLPLSDLAEMRQRVLAERDVAAPASDAAAVTSPEPVARPQPKRLLHIPPQELMLAGFIENRGLALVAAAMAALWQIDPVEKLIGERLPEMAPEWAQRAAEAGVTANATMLMLGAFTLFLAAVVFIRLLSTVWAVIRLYDFTLTRDGNDLRAEYGLFTRVTATIPVRRVQTVSIHQRWLHRRLDRAAIRVTTAGATGIPGPGDEKADREWLAPIVRTADVRSLIHQVDPSLEVDGIEWTRAHPRAARRMMRVSAIAGAIVAGASAFVLGWWSLAVGALLGIRAVARARGIAANIGCAIVGDRVAFRSGWLHHVVSIARFERIQSAVCDQTPFDRRAGMASVGVDTAGMGQTGLSMPYLAEPVAVKLHAQLAQAAVQTPFTWS